MLLAAMAAAGILAEACDGAGPQSPAATIPSDTPAVTPAATPNLEATVAALLATALSPPTPTPEPTSLPTAAPVRRLPRSLPHTHPGTDANLKPITTPIAQLPDAPGYSTVTAGGKHTCRRDANGIATCSKAMANSSSLKEWPSRTSGRGVQRDTRVPSA